jgi:hypothetical protein
MFLFNLNTLIESLTSDIKTAAKNINTIISNASSGMTLDNAIEELENLNISRAYGEMAYSFD